MVFFFSSRRRHTRLQGDWSSDVCSSDLTTPVGVRALYRPAQFDSMQARARAVADSLKRLQDTTARKDTTARRGTPAPAPQRAPAVAGAPGAPSRRDTSTARVDTAPVRKLPA